MKGLGKLPSWRSSLRGGRGAVPVFAAIAGLWLVGCDRQHRSPSGGDGAPAASAGSVVGTTAARRSSPPTASAVRPVPTPPSRATVSASATAAATAAAAAADAAAAAPLAASPSGNELFLGVARPIAVGPMGALALAGGDELAVAALAGDTPSPLPEPREQLPFYPVAVAGDGPAHAYWVNRGRLVRRSVGRDGQVGKLEVLAEDAASGTVVAAARLDGPPAKDVAVYVRAAQNEQGERGAGLWLEGQGARHLGGVVGGATGLALAPVTAQELSLVVLDGRNAMSSVHALELTLSGDGTLRVGDDRVVYVAGGVQWHTCPEVIACGGKAVALLPVAKGITDFGLVSLLISGTAKQAKESWVDYPNGLDPAPVAAATICGEPLVALVRPEKAEPGATQLVQLGRLDGSGQVVGLRTVAAAGVVSHLALGAAAASGEKKGRGRPAGWLAYSTDAGLWAKALACDEP